MKILVIKPTALGDVAQALKVVPWLKRSGVAHQLDWVVDTDYLPVLEVCPDIDRRIPFPRRAWRGGFRPLEMLAWARGLRGDRYDVVLDLQGLARSALMTRVARAGIRVGLASAREGAKWVYDRRVPDVQTHAVDRYAAAVASIIGPGTAVTPLTFSRPEKALPMGLEAGGYTVFHPYSLWQTKLWPWESFRKLEQALEGETVVWVGSGPFFPTASARSVDMRGKTPLPDLLALLAGARAVIGTDSGPAHLAALFDVPVITLFGATDPDLTGPVAAKGECLVTEGPPCRPCRSRTCNWETPMACLSDLSVERVHSIWKRWTRL
ncbi:MAG: glycosyltransferase family 9 protein [Candidatus Methylacidiphilales bacterium]|nr:glycosyltransferase family 9 protein [Candidatus Methylacidiphilales bacterium]